MTIPITRMAYAANSQRALDSCLRQAGEEPAPQRSQRHRHDRDQWQLVIVMCGRVIIKIKTIDQICPPKTEQQGPETPIGCQKKSSRPSMTKNPPTARSTLVIH